MSYQLIAFDMDGTLLDDRKQIPAENIRAIREAAEAGKTVILSTGRCPAELQEQLEQLPWIRYVVCLSGALVYDTKMQQIIFSRELDEWIVRKLLEISSHEDVMLQILSKESHIQRSFLSHMGDYHIEAYHDMYSRVSTMHENLPADYLRSPFSVSKFNQYHTSTQSRHRTEQRVLSAGLPVELVYAESTSLEASPLHVSKGEGLRLLCDYLGLNLSETIAVGDSDNDLSILRTAGLAVAVGNANDNVREIAGAIVADNNHAGCAEAIRRLLLV